MIDIDELLNSLLSDSIPFLIKRHYFNLLYEVYLKKVPGLNTNQRLNVQDIKFVQVLQYVVQYDLDNSYKYLNGLVTESQPDDSDFKKANIEKVHNMISKDIEHHSEMLKLGKSDQERQEELRLKQMVCSFKDMGSFPVLNKNDQSEFWRYLFDNADGKESGMLLFVENLY